ncbi:MAG: hypothetical protein JXR70_18405 [Spirochaetales bacterium]|nr:hypothetical protein [Spirochaetales bacterium]
MSLVNKIYPYELEIKGEKYTAIPSGLTKTRVLQTRLAAMKQRSGYLVGEKEIEPWKVSGFSEELQGLALYGPHFQGETLHALAEKSTDHFFTGMQKLLKALMVLRQNKIDYFPLQSNSVLVGEAEVLFIPYELASEVNEYHDFELKREVKNYILHPDFDGEKAWSYSLACLLFRNLTGEYPFQGDDEIQLNHEMRNLELSHKLLYYPEINKDVRDFIASCFKKESAPSLQHWLNFIAKWQDQSIFQKVSESDRLQSLEEARKKEKIQQQLFGSLNFWRKYWQQVAIIAVVVIAIGSVVATSIGNAFFRELQTKGFTPRQVVEAYYKSINDLDVMMLDDCLADGAGQNMMTYVSNIFVISRQMMSINQKNPIISAEEWDKAGRPYYDDGTQVSGIVKLSITMLQDEPAPLFRNEYEFWRTEADPEADIDELKLVFIGDHIVEDLYLRKDREFWVISKIESIKNEPIPYK